MRFILVDWGTTRFRAFVVDGETIVDRVSSDEGVLGPARRAAPGGLPQALPRLAGARAAGAGRSRRHGRKPRRLAHGALCAMSGGPAGNRRRHDRGRDRRRPQGPHHPGARLRARCRRGRRHARRGDAVSRGRHHGRADLPAWHAPEMGRDEGRANRTLRDLFHRRDVRAPAPPLDGRPAGDANRRTRPASIAASTPPSATAACPGGGSGSCISSSAPAPRP